ncbi:hypothetical protein AAMO2058_000236200 [Amorphochlora amoebiformis]
MWVGRGGRYHTYSFGTQRGLNPAIALSPFLLIPLLIPPHHPPLKGGGKGNSSVIWALRGGRGGKNRRWRKVEIKAEHEERYKHRIRKKLRRLRIKIPEPDPQATDTQLYAKRRSERQSLRAQKVEGFYERKEARDKESEDAVRNNPALQYFRRKRDRQKQKKKSSRRWLHKVKGKVKSYLKRGMNPKDYKPWKRRKQ